MWKGLYKMARRPKLLPYPSAETGVHEQTQKLHTVLPLFTLPISQTNQSMLEEPTERIPNVAAPAPKPLRKPQRVPKVVKIGSKYEKFYVTRPFLPAHPQSHIAKQLVQQKINRKKKKLSPARRLGMIFQELLYLSIALTLGFLVHIVLAGNPIYQFVCWAIIVVLWSNFSSATLRTYSRKKMNKVLTTLHLPAIPKTLGRTAHLRSLQDDTTAYLKAIRNLGSMKERK